MDTDLLNELKNLLHIPLNITDDDQLLSDYINSAKAYLDNACNNEMAADDRYKFIIIELATQAYENRGTNLVTKDFPYSLRCVINQLKHKQPYLCLYQLLFLISYRKKHHSLP